MLHRAVVALTDGVRRAGLVGTLILVPLRDPAALSQQNKKRGGRHVSFLSLKLSYEYELLAVAAYGGRPFLLATVSGRQGRGGWIEAAAPERVCRWLRDLDVIPAAAARQVRPVDSAVELPA
jgi:hypothetical protein